MVSAAIVERAIHQSAKKTAESDDAVSSTYFEVMGQSKREISFSSLLAASQALLKGDSSRALGYEDKIAPYATWGSWIEGIPFAHATLLNEGMLVDIIPCKTESEFIKAYCCHPRQFLELTRTMADSGRDIYLNFRDYDPKRPDTLEKYKHQPDSLNQIYAYAAEAGRDRFYVHAVRLPTLLKMFGSDEVMYRWEQDLGGHGKHAIPGMLFDLLTKVLNAENSTVIRLNYPGAFVRGNYAAKQLPVPIQMFKRIIYHLTFSEICSEIPRNETIAKLATALVSGDNVTSDLVLRSCALANELHHAYTAPLTGAYGGTYNLTEEEFSPDFEKPEAVVTGAHRRSVLEFLYGTMADKIRVKDNRLEALRDVSGAISLMQKGEAPEDGELRNFMSFMPESRSFLRKRSELMKALHDSVRRSNGDVSQLDSLIGEAEAAFRSCNSVWRKLSKNAFIGLGIGVATAASGSVFGVVGAPIGLLGDLFVKALESTRPMGDKAAETMLDPIYDRIVDRRNDRKQIVRILQDVRG